MDFASWYFVGICKPIILFCILHANSSSPSNTPSRKRRMKNFTPQDTALTTLETQTYRLNTAITSLLFRSYTHSTHKT